MAQRKWSYSHVDSNRYITGHDVGDLVVADVEQRYARVLELPARDPSPDNEKISCHPERVAKEIDSRTRAMRPVHGHFSDAMVSTARQDQKFDVE